MSGSHHQVDNEEDEIYLDMQTQEESFKMAQQCARTLAVIAHANGMREFNIDIEGLVEQGIVRGDWNVSVKCVKQKYVVM